MIIKSKCQDEPKLLQIKDIQPGTVFSLSGTNHLYLKVSDIDKKTNCIDLPNSVCMCFYDHTLVGKVYPKATMLEEGCD